jgi:hypothetical protein
VGGSTAVLTDRLALLAVGSLLQFRFIIFVSVSGEPSLMFSDKAKGNLSNSM